MRIKFGLFVGFALGFYFGSMAGKERHKQLNSMIKKLSTSAPVDAAAGKAKHAADNGIHKAKDTVVRRFQRDYIVETEEFMPS